MGDVMPNVVTETKLNTPAEEAAACRVTKPTLLGWYHAGIIPAVYAVGRIIRFDHAEVMKALAELNREGAR